MDIKSINEKMQQLYEAASFLNEYDPGDLPKAYKPVFGKVSDITYDLEKAGTEDGIVPELHEAQIVFQAKGDEDDVSDVASAMISQYAEFEGKANIEVKDDGNFEIKFDGLWLGETDDLIRMTHHAEALYEGTDCEYVHVEVCADGEWYGRVPKESGIDTTTYLELLEARNRLCKYCKNDECKNCQVTKLIDDATCKAEEAGIVENC